MRRILLLAACAAASFGAHANLIVNGSNELSLVGGEITGWTETLGTTWGQRSADPTAKDGTYYFFAGANERAILSQTVDLSAYAADIDAGRQQFDFSGWVHSWPQSPSDTSQIVISWLAADSSVLNSFDSGAIVSTDAWWSVNDSRLAPALTRSLRIDLVADRNAGSNNDGYFDGLVMETTTVPVPEPATAALAALGLAMLGLRRLRRPD